MYNNKGPELTLAFKHLLLDLDLDLDQIYSILLGLGQSLGQGAGVFQSFRTASKSRSKSKYIAEVFVELLGSGLGDLRQRELAYKNDRNRSAIFSVVNPNSSARRSPGAEAPKWSIPIE